MYGEMGEHSTLHQQSMDYLKNKKRKHHSATLTEYKQCEYITT